MPEINYLAVVVAALGSFLLGGLWYSPALFGKVWQREAGLLWVAGSFGINYLFERRSFKLFCINGGYHTLQFAIFGLVLALLPCKDCAPVPCAP